MIILIFAFLLGLIFGSFINAFLWRYETKKSMAGRSICPKCSGKIIWYDNVPLLSWLILGGKCRNCKKKISIAYPLIELTAALLFTIVAAYSNSGIYIRHITNTLINLGPIFQGRYLAIGMLELGITLSITTMLTIIAVHDYKTKEIPNGFNMAFGLLALAFLTVTSIWPAHGALKFSYGVLSGAVAFLFFYAFVFFSKETWMGGGDAKFSLGMGLLLGPAGTFLAVLIASVSGSIYGIANIIIAKRKNKKVGHRHEIPFGPFLALGTYASMVFGPQIIDWYVKIILGL